MALALVAALGLVASAQANTTYTWTGASTVNNNWFTSSTGFFTGTSENFSPSPLATSLTTTDLLFGGSTRPSTVLNRSFSANSLTFNTDTGFTISPLASQQLTIGAGGIVNQVAQQQTFNTIVTLNVAATDGTNPVNVVSGGEVVFNNSVSLFGSRVLEKLGSGTVTFKTNFNSTNGFVKSTAGTTNLTETFSNYQISVDVNGGQVNLAACLT